MLYLVTGCAGFIGWKVASLLIQQGHRVIGVDNLNDYYDIRLKEWRLSQLRAYRHAFVFTHLDITAYEALKLLFQIYQFDGVFNIAARAGVRASVEDPWTYYDTNTRGALNILECCRRYGVKKVVQASTSSVYGLNETPFRVEDNTDRVISPYAASKKATEALCHSYYYLYDLDISIPRYFSVYGPAGRPDMAYFKFMVAIDKGLPIPIYGDGTQARDFTYVDDVAEATVQSIELEGYNIFNVGDDNPVELRRIIEMIEKGLNKQAKCEYHPRHRADNLVTWSDISRTRKLLNWEPRVKIEQGMEQVLRWYLENREWVRELDIL
ncbi:MAG: NAD-dependent epimerase/dehydratase family protein [Calditrichaeota bacterium]|nr:MAG: NAD-dependent epimerase/dehydratase family protein [Calditrichota bacterium]